MSEPADDKTFPDASSRALGRMFGEMMAGMLETGMTRDEALQVMIEYASALASRPTQEPGQ